MKFKFIVIFISFIKNDISVDYVSPGNMNI